MTNDFRFRRILLMWLVATALLFAPVSLLAQRTNIDAPDNKYSISDDIRIGREAAAQVEQRMPMLPEGGDVDDYVRRVGRRLVNGIPREFRHSQFDYEFDVVNARDINAFALRGGPLYVNRMSPEEREERAKAMPGVTGREKPGTSGEAKARVNVPEAEKPTPAQQRAPPTQRRPPIIDMHMHADLPPHEVPPGAPALCRPEPCRGEGHATVNHRETLKKTLDMMDRYNIVKAFVSGVDLGIVQQWVVAAPGRFLAAPFILQPGRPGLKVLKQEYAAGRLHGLGEIATQLTGVPPNDPALEPYFAMAEERDLPVLIHTLGIGPYLPGFRVGAGNPLLLEDVLVRHPKLRLYVENTGYPYRGEMIAMMTQYPQLYADVSTITWVIPRGAFYDYLQAFVRAGLGKRLMFGSDQMRWPEKIGTGIEAIEQAPFLSDEQKRDILYNNAVRFLRLKQDSR